MKNADQPHNLNGMCAIKFVVSHHYRAHSICCPFGKLQGCANNGYFSQSEDPLIKHSCVAHLLLLKSKYSDQVCSSPRAAK